MTRIHVEFEDEVELGACCVPEVELEICPGSPTPSTPRTPLSKSTSFFGAPPTMTQAAHNAAATMKKDEDEYGNEQADTTLEKSRLQALIKPILLTTVFLLACGLLYTEVEGWDFGVACYFWFITFSTIGEERVCRPVGVVSADFAPVRVHCRARRLCTCTRESNRNRVSDHDRPRVSVEFAQCDPGGQPFSSAPFPPFTHRRSRRTGSGPWRMSVSTRTLGLSPRALPGDYRRQAGTRRRPSAAGTAPLSKVAFQ